MIQADLNVYCAGHLSGTVDSRIIQLPDGFVTEAEALGAKVCRTRDGFETVQYLFDAPEALYNLPCLASADPILRVLARLRSVPKDKSVLLKANAPYSILASLVEPKRFYRWLVKHGPAIHGALERVAGALTVYLRQAFSFGASIVSIADPYANIQALGENRWREYAAPYLTSLLENIASTVAAKPAKIIHICPHSSVPLARLGYMRAGGVPSGGVSYIDALLRLANRREGLVILGGQCIYAGGQWLSPLLPVS